ncbi:hypothetical protein FUAX_24570 [Fulvitalea axinellae]|uniref:Capsule assembly Wzi family protein n=1 Tax=Fulvitalea axinellae TaxID=1182444 RepID=A0AAU9CL46_9BACT|nr:hypothetical protein FUAX_24570 [Fulvitalea axinellae]
MKIRIPALLSLFVLLYSQSEAQDTSMPFNRDTQHRIDKAVNLSGNKANIHTGLKPFDRSDIKRTLETAQEQGIKFSPEDIFLLDQGNWLAQDSLRTRKGFLKYFFTNGNDFYHVNEDRFKLRLNPVLYVGGGIEKDADDKLFINTRGAEVEGLIGKKIGFYSYIATTQARYPEYVIGKVNQGNAIPTEGYWKKFKETGYDYFTARGYISFNPIEEINVKFGYDKLFVGEGYRSMILSDNPNAYLFLKTDTKVWKIRYTNLWAKMTSQPFGHFNQEEQSAKFAKYFAMHRLGINITPTLNVGLSETITYGDVHENGEAYSPKAEFFVPVIFYRAIELETGSYDTDAKVALDAKWNPWPRLSLYGQFLLDEFNLKFFKQDGWWANKYAVQAGAKYYDALGIKDLDLQAEFNTASPYTYAHATNYTSYTHYGLSLAHPLGANFTELVGIARYRPHRRLEMVLTSMFADYGTSDGDNNWGDDPNRSYNDRVQDFDNKIGQGITNQTITADLRLSYRLFSNAFIDLRQIVRNHQMADQPDKTAYASTVAFRWNISAREDLY